MTDVVNGVADQAEKVTGQATKTATNTALSATKQDPLRADFERKADQLQRRRPRTTKSYDESEEEESDPEFIPVARYGKHRIVPVRQSRISDRPQSEKDSTMRIKIELDLEVEVEIYARVKGDVTIGLL
jgi:hypothetical protein